MTDFQNKRSESKEKATAMPAIVRANEMFREVCGPRGWNDTRESWIARGARLVGITARRARAIVYQEPIRLTADEYLAIERAYATAHASVATLSALARDAAVRAGRVHAVEGQGTDGEG